MSSDRILRVVVIGGAFALSSCFLDVPALVDAGAGGDGASGGAGGEPIGGAGGEGACPSGLGDCDGDGSCEVNLTSDDESCAVCARSCLGAACVDALCTPHGLGGQIDEPRELVAHGTYVYYTFGSRLGARGVGRVRVTGASPRTLIEQADRPAGLAVYVDSDRAVWLYWADGATGALHRLPAHTDETSNVAEPGPDSVDELVHPGPGAPAAAGDASVAVDENRAFWSVEQAGVIAAVDWDGGSFEQIATDELGPAHLVVVGEYLYWTGAFAGLHRARKDGTGGVESIESMPIDPLVHRGRGITVDDGILYWRESDEDGGAGRVLRFDPERDDAGQTLVQSPGAEGIATDGTFLFWVGDSSGEVWRANMDGTSMLLLADQQPDPTGIAADADGPFAYWTTSAPVPDGGVYRVVK